ncbi:hypothetical protein GYH30_045136 [Glycine max]|uniref:Uncharacterized protein n=1 Tax=Glycine max TaxID=3847 RepID=A0A0R0FQX9_SOYBN|nr:hypothetical protein GYH30_045136 [Glycine max]
MAAERDNHGTGSEHRKKKILNEKFRHSNLELYSRISLTFQFPLSSHMLCLLLSLLQLGLRISNCQWHTAETDPSSIPLHSPYSFGSISPNTPKMVKH